MSALVHDDHTIPHRCRHVYYALSGIIGHTEYTRVHGKWRYIDLINITGRNSSDRKLRELREECRGLICEETVNGDSGPYSRFWLSTASPLRRVELQPVTTSQDGLLFDLSVAVRE